MFPVDRSQSTLYSGEDSVLLSDDYDLEWISRMFPLNPQEIAEKQSKLALYVLGTSLGELHARYDRDVPFQTEIKELATSDIAGKSEVLASRIKKITDRIAVTLPLSAETQLFDACKRHDCQAVVTILQQLKPKQNCRNREGQTPLHAILATGQFHPETVQALIAYNSSWLDVRDFSGKYPHEYVNTSSDAIHIARAGFPGDSFKQLAYLLKAHDAKLAAEYFRTADLSVWTVPVSDASWQSMKLVLACAWETGKKDMCREFLEVFYKQNPTLAVLSLACEIDPELARHFVGISLGSQHPCQWPDSVDLSACAPWKHKPLLQNTSPLLSRLEDMRLALRTCPALIPDGDLGPWVKTLFLDDEQELPVLSPAIIRENIWLKAFLRSETFPVKKLLIKPESINTLYKYLPLFSEQAARYIVEQTTPSTVFYPFTHLLSSIALVDEDHAHNCKVFDIVLQNKALQCWDTLNFMRCISSAAFVKLWLWIFEHHPAFKIDPSLMDQFLRAVISGPENQQVSKEGEFFIQEFITRYPKAVRMIDVRRVSDPCKLFCFPYILQHTSDVYQRLHWLGYFVLERALLSCENSSAQSARWRQFVKQYALRDCMNHVSYADKFISSLSEKIDLSGIVQDSDLNSYVTQKGFRDEVFKLLFSLRGQIYSCAQNYSKKTKIGKCFGTLATKEQIEKYIGSRQKIPGWSVQCQKADQSSLSLILTAQIEGQDYVIFRGYATYEALIQFIDEYEKRYIPWHQVVAWVTKVPKNWLISFHHDDRTKEISVQKKSFVNNQVVTSKFAFGKDFHDTDSFRRLVDIDNFFENERQLLSQHFPGIPIVFGTEKGPENGVFFIHIEDTIHVQRGNKSIDVKTMEELVHQVFDYYMHDEHQLFTIMPVRERTLRDMYFTVHASLFSASPLLARIKGIHFDYPSDVAGGSTLVMLRGSGSGPGHSAQLIARSNQRHHEINELMQLHTAKEGLFLNVAACNAYTRRANDAMKDLHVLPERPAPVDLKLLLNHFNTQKNNNTFARSLQVHKLSPEIAYQNLDDFIRCVIEKKGIRGWNPVTYQKEYKELEISLTHAVQEFLRKNDTGNINSLIVEMCACPPNMCANWRADIGRSGYNLAFNISSRSLIKDVANCESIDDMLLLGYTQAFLETIDTMTKMVLDPRAIAQSTHVNSCIRKLLKKELLLDSPRDPRLSLYQNEVGRDEYSATGAEEFPAGSVSFFFPALFSIEYARKLRNIQDELIKEKKWPLLGALKQTLSDALEDCLKQEHPLCMQAKKDYMLQVGKHNEKVEEAKKKLENAKLSLLQSEHVEVVREYKAHKNQLAVLDQAVQAAARGLLEKAKEIGLLEEKARLEKTLPKITRLCPDADVGIQPLIDDQARELKQLEQSQEQQKKEIEAIVQIGRELFESNAAILAHEKLVKEHAACENEYNTACQNRSGIIQVLEGLSEREHLSNPQDDPETLTLRAWVHILRFRGILQPEARRSLSTASTPG